MEEYRNIHNQPIEKPADGSAYFQVFHDGAIQCRISFSGGQQEFCIYEGIRADQVAAYPLSRHPGLPFQLHEGACVHFFSSDGQFLHRTCTRQLGPDMEVEEEFDADGNLTQGQALVSIDGSIRYALEFGEGHEVFNVYSFSDGGPVALEEVAEWIALLPNQA